MVLSCCRLISLLVAFNLIGTEHAETNLDSLCLREELKSSTLRAATLSTDTVCCRRCRSIIQDQENRGVSTEIKLFNIWLGISCPNKLCGAIGLLYSKPGV